MTYFVYSTMTSGVDYAFYARNTSPQGGVNKTRKVISIKGGANSPTSPMKGLITPKGVVTTIEDSDYELLKNHLVFKQHLAAGHVTVERSKAKVDTVVKNMTPKDGSAVAIAADFKTPPKSVGKMETVFPGSV